MTYMEHLRYKPKALFRLDDTSSPFKDYSGYNKTATLTGTLTNGLPLTTWNANSLRVDNSNTVSYAAAPVYVQGVDVNRPFSIVASAYRLDIGSGNQKILSSTNNYDGLTINGTVVSFTTTYTTSGSATASYDIGQDMRCDIVGVHSSTKNSLYINGTMVAEVALTTEQQADTYAVTGTTLISGTSTGTAALLLNMVAMYDSALNPDAIQAIYTAINRRSNTNSLKSYNGHDIPLGRLGTIYEWKTDDDWNQATLVNCAVEKDTLFAQTYNGLTFAATWYDTVDLSATSTGLTLNAVDIYYTGQNVLLEASLDNSTWQTVTVGANLTVAPQGTSADNTLFLRATFTSGVAEAKLTYMGVRIYTDPTYTPPVSGRTLTFNNPTTLVNTRDPMGFYDDNGFHLKNAKLIIGADSTDVPVGISTIEVWFKPYDAPGNEDVFLIDTRPAGTGAVELVDYTTVTTTAGTLYRNGMPDASIPITKNGWNVVHLVLNTPTTGAININGHQVNSGTSGDIMLGKVVLYENALTAADVAKIVNNYTGIPTIVQTANVSVVIAESTPATTIVAQDYTTVAID